eukprot:5706840-Prymnesium_polylepis.2
MLADIRLKDAVPFSSANSLEREARCVAVSCDRQISTNAEGSAVLRLWMRTMEHMPRFAPIFTPTGKPGVGNCSSMNSVGTVLAGEDSALPGFRSGRPRQVRVTEAEDIWPTGRRIKLRFDETEARVMKEVSRAELTLWAEGLQGMPPPTRWPVAGNGDYINRILPKCVRRVSEASVCQELGSTGLSCLRQKDATVQRTVSQNERDRVTLRIGCLQRHIDRRERGSTIL